MTALRYRAWRRSLGDERRAARVLGCAPDTILQREAGYSPITEDAARRVIEAVWDAAIAEDVRREERRARIRERRADRRGMTAAEFRAAIAALGWMSRRQAARELLGEASDAARISAWATGRVIVPEWVAHHLRAYLHLETGDPWPAPDETAAVETAR